jgi:hypothetical protein
MAERYAVGHGSWSAVGTWDGGASLPGAGDTVHANGFNVTMDQDVTVGSIRTDAGTTASAGGQFFSATAGITINADVVGGTNSLNCLNTTTDDITVNGDLQGGSTGSSSAWNCSGDDCTVNGNVTGGGGADCFGLKLSSASDGFTLNGDCTAGAGDTAAEIAGVNTIITGDITAVGLKVGIELQSFAKGCVITGDVTAASVGGISAAAERMTVTGDVYGAAATGIACNQEQAIINGNVFGGTSSSAHGVEFLDSGVLNGNATGGSASSARGVSGDNTWAFIHNGNATGGSAVNAYGCFMNASGSIFEGEATGGSVSGAHGVYAFGAFCFVHATVATGNTSGAYGVDGSNGANHSIIIIDSESGSYAKNLDSTVNTDVNNVPFFDTAGGGSAAPVLPQTIQSISDGIAL